MPGDTARSDRARIWRILKPECNLFRIVLVQISVPAAVAISDPIMRRPSFLLLLPIVFAAPAAAQTRDSVPTQTVRAAPLAGEIRLDGQLDEAAWAAAQPATDFTESYPNAGAPASLKTEARVLYGSDAIYVGVRAFDPHPDSIAAQLARRDASGIYSDWIHVAVDSYNDRRSAFRFSVNPRGVKKDVFHFNDTNEDLNWDAVWEVATAVDSLGWTAEYRIPYSQIRFSGAEPPGGRTWGLQVQRDVARREARFSWSPWARNTPGYVSRFGYVTGLVGIRPSRRLEIQPYLSSRLTRAPGDDANPFYSANDAGISVGADVKVGLTSGLTLTGTVNPDFGQVEVDPAVVNLTAFEVRFPEKRPFFVEGADILRFGQVRNFNNAFGQDFFYSRRIGRTPQRRLGGRDILYVDAPEQSTILGAARVSGKAGPWTIGAMNAVTAAEEAQYLERFEDAAGDTLRRTRSAPVEPLTNYFVGRVRREMRGGNTVAGGMFTTANRDMSDTVFTPILHSGAYFGGVDFEHAWAKRVWMISGYLAGSHVQGSEAILTATQRASARYFQRPDADYVELDTTRTSLTGHMEEIALSRSGGGWDASLDYKAASPGFEINDLGFQGRTDYRSLNALIGHNVNEPGRIFRNYNVFSFATRIWNWGWTNIGDHLGVGANATFTSLWNTGVNFRFSPETLDDRLTRGGPLASTPGRQWRFFTYLNSDSRKAISYGLETFLSGDAAGGYDRGVELDLSWRPSPNLRFGIEPEVIWSHGTSQYVGAFTDPLANETFGRRYVFADLNQTTAILETRLDWTFSPNLSLQLFAQPFIAAGDYMDFKEFLTPREYDFAVYGRDRGTIERGAPCAGRQSATLYTVDPDGAGPASCFQFGERDFNFRSLRGNAVLRWEYRPGSALFLVWQQQRDGRAAVGTFDFGRDAGEVFRAPATNVFLIKATYWIGS